MKDQFVYTGQVRVAVICAFCRQPAEANHSCTIKKETENGENQKEKSTDGQDSSAGLPGISVA